MTSVEINGEEYELTDNPSMGTVKDVQKMQIQILMDYLDEDDLRDMDGLNESEFINVVVEKEGMDVMQEMIWSRSILTAAQTISLATDDVFDVDEIEDMGARDFREILQECEEVLGGDADDFFEMLGVGTNLSQREAQEVRNQRT